MPELADVFADLEDPRAINARRHSLHDILVIALCTIVCGGQTCTDMELFGQAKGEFLQSFLKLENGIPATTPFRGCWECWIQRRSSSGFWGSWSSLPKAVMGWWPWT